MKRAVFLLPVILLLSALLLPGSVSAQRVTPTWNSAIYYYNPTFPDVGHVQAIFMGTGTVPEAAPKDIPPHGFGRFLIGSTGDFQGAAILSADVPLAAVYKQFDINGSAFAPLLYSSFDVSQAGDSGFFYVPSVMRSGSYTSRIGIQNVELVPVNLHMTFYDRTGAVKATLDRSLTTGDNDSSYIFSITPAVLPDLGSSFDGSLVIEAVKDDGSGDPARVVAAVEEIMSTGQRSYAFEGSGVTGTKIFMPSAMCNYGTGRQTSYFAVQNAGSAPATVEVRYYSASGALLALHKAGTVAPKARLSINSCDTKVYARFTGKTGTAVIESKGTTPQPLVAVGKVTGRDGLSTAYLGQVSGAQTVLLPYLEWSRLVSDPRTTISIMNISDSAATDIRVRFYYDAGGNFFDYQERTLATASKPLGRNGRVNVDPVVSGAALDANGNYLGAAEVISNRPVAVLVRLTQKISGVTGITLLGEDYIGMPYNPIP